MSSPGDSGLGADLTVRPVIAGDDLNAGVDLWHRAFGPPGAGEPERWLADLSAGRDAGRLLGAWDGGQQVGLALYDEMRQWWHGRDLPMAGVSGVAVAPESRGRGVGRALMTGLLRSMAERRYPLSALYPATSRLYRSLGWEVAGSRYLAEIPARSLAALLPPDPAAGSAPGPTGTAGVRRTTEADADQVIAVLGAICRTQLDCGPTTRDREAVRRLLASDSVFSYLAPDGFLSYSWDTGRDLLVNTLRAVSPRTLREFWSIVANHATIAGTVRVALGPADPITWLTSEPDVRIRSHKNWMLRVLCPESAIAGRGFPAAVSLDVMLALSDPDLPDLTHPYRLRVGEGLGTLDPETIGETVQGPSGPWVTCLGPRGFAAMYAGVPMATLRQAGLVVGGDRATDALLDSAFGATSYLLDLF